MGELSEFQTGMRLFLRAYPWRRIDPVPWAPLPRPLADLGYRIFAKLRYRVFGRLDECRAPTPAERGRFLA